ncbi:MAG: hypothetical protein CVU03_00755 [Bacteroidetes bacterium HGW-Bacteroidetes-2]|jgi:hypothetical protein|nr:MAG: hypothetical protein CVU03_00755 [Bacteroidetes bacterium HGW-Bacteroidetes-2]
MTLYKYAKFFLLIGLLSSCNQDNKERQKVLVNENVLIQKAETTINTWHLAASNADFGTYFSLMTSDGVFIGTDATENWQNEEFKTYSKPHFDKGKAWSFTPIERNTYVDKEQNTIWFDELLNTRMGICRGSGIMKLEDDHWKIKHYVLSIAIPNEKATEVILLKKEWDSIFIQTLKEPVL